MAKVINAQPADVLKLGKEMGLPDPQPISDSQWRRSYITIIKRNWHLLPYEQLLQLLDWTPDQLAYTLREDDFLFVKLGQLKPKCEPLVYHAPDAPTLARLGRIAEVVRQELPAGINPNPVPLFDFVRELSSPLSEADKQAARDQAGKFRFSPRFCAIRILRSMATRCSIRAMILTRTAIWSAWRPPASTASGCRRSCTSSPRSPGTPS